MLFTNAESRIERLLAWPQLRSSNHGTNPTITKLWDLHSGLHKLIKIFSNLMTNNGTIYGNIYRKAIDSGANHHIHVYSTAPCRAGRQSLEVARCVHVHIYQRNYGPSHICRKCRSPLNNIHKLGRCRFTTKLETKHHNSSTYTLLFQLLQKSYGGRWPIPGVDWGNKPVTDFAILNTDMDATPQTHTFKLSHTHF
jgi:hypothetical protein